MQPPLAARIAALYAKEPGIDGYLRFVEARNRQTAPSLLPARVWPACAATVLEAARQFLGEPEAHLDRHIDPSGSRWIATLAEPGAGGCRGGGGTPMEAVVALWEAVLA